MTQTILTPLFSDILSNLAIRVVGTNQFIYPLKDRRYCQIEPISDALVKLHFTFSFSGNKLDIAIKRWGASFKNEVEGYTKSDRFDHSYEIYFNATLILKGGAEVTYVHSLLSGPTVLWCGFPRREKAPSHFWQLARKFREQNVRFTLVGPPQQSRENVTCLGFVSDEELIRQFRTCSVYCITSVWAEPCGYTHLQAMAVGKVVIGYNVGGIPEYVKDGETGFLVSVGDVDALANALKKLLEDEKLLTSMGHAAIDNVRKNFTVPKMAEKYLTLYLELLQN